MSKSKKRSLSKEQLGRRQILRDYKRKKDILKSKKQKEQMLDSKYAQVSDRLWYDTHEKLIALRYNIQLQNLALRKKNKPISRSRYVQERTHLLKRTNFELKKLKHAKQLRVRKRYSQKIQRNLVASKGMIQQGQGLAEQKAQKGLVTIKSGETKSKKQTKWMRSKSKNYRPRPSWKLYPAQQYALKQAQSKISEEKERKNEYLEQSVGGAYVQQPKTTASGKKYTEFIRPIKKTDGSLQYGTDSVNLTQTIDNEGKFKFAPKGNFTGTLTVHRKDANGKIIPEQADIVEYANGKPIRIQLANIGKSQIANIDGIQKEVGQHKIRLPEVKLPFGPTEVRRGPQSLVPPVLPKGQSKDKSIGKT